LGKLKDYTMFHNNKGGTLSNQCSQNAEAKASKSIMTPDNNKQNH